MSTGASYSPSHHPATHNVNSIRHSARADRVKKRALYQEKGVETYWVVDIDARLVEVWRPGDERPAIVTEALRWCVAPDTPEMTIQLDAVFATLPQASPPTRLPASPPPPRS